MVFAIGFGLYADHGGRRETELSIKASLNAVCGHASKVIELGGD
jgi:hypothetical protein